MRREYIAKICGFLYTHRHTGIMICAHSSMVEQQPFKLMVLGSSPGGRIFLGEVKCLVFAFIMAFIVKQRLVQEMILAIC